MICCVNKLYPDASPKDHMTMDLDTGRLIEDCKWSNDETGEYCVYARDSAGRIIRQWINPAFRHFPVENWRSRENEAGGGIQARTEIRKGNIKIVKVRAVKHLNGSLSVVGTSMEVVE